MSNYPTGAMHDKYAPFNRSDMDPRHVRAIDRRAQELASAGFDERDDWASDWLRDNCDLHIDVVCAAISWHTTDVTDDLYAAIERLRERYIVDSVDLYRERAIQELTDERVIA